MNADSIITAISKKAEQSASPGDYVKDDLLYCGHCDTPKQCRINYIDGTVRIVGCQCACASRRYDAERKAREDQERRLRIENLRTEGIRDRGLADCRFDTAEETAELAKCRRYAEHWQEMERENSGLLLWGNTGNGKTFAAACIANYLIDRGIPATAVS